MLAGGVNDITLLGQNVNAYQWAGPGGWTGAALRSFPTFPASRGFARNEPPARHGR